MTSYMMKIILPIMFFLIGSVAFASGVIITPLQVDLGKDNSVVTLSVVNRNNSSTTFQLSAKKWQQKNGVDITTKTNDLIVTPPIVKIAPKQTKLVRVGLRSVQKWSPIERTYRMYLTQLPNHYGHSSKKKEFGMHFLFTFSLPVFIKPSTSLKKELKWSASVKGNALRVTMKNIGNVHAKVLNLIFTSNKSNKSLMHSKKVFDILARTKKSWTIKLSNARLIGKKLKVISTTNWGRRAFVVPIT